MEKLIKTHAGAGKLIFEESQPAAEVIYSIGEFQEYDEDVPTVRNTRGRISHAVGHPHWNHMMTLFPGPFTLVLTDGRKLKVLMENLEGSVKGTGAFF